MSTVIFYILTALALLVSVRKDKARTVMALRKAWKAFENILPQFLGVIILVGLLIAALDPAAISRIIGRQSGWFGVVAASVVGAVTLIPGFVAFPTAALLLENGAGVMQIGAFVSSLMMVGVMTFPVEVKFFGARLTILRNGIAFLFSFVVAFVLYLVVAR